jgi:peptidoglycan/xylan/chitin deacetylase (PgdA/CDA1 family)
VCSSDLQATGFLIGEGLGRDPARAAAAEAWVAAGYEVGNHTFRHLAFGDLDASAYLKDVDDNRSVVAQYEKRLGQTTHYFRCPYLDEGATDEARRALRHDLRVHHDTLARVSIDFDDWAFSVPFERCVSAGDPAQTALLQKAYVEHGVSHLVWADIASRSLLGRTMPHVLLLHANPVTAASLDELLKAYDARGVQYVSLGEALRDPIYRGNYPTSGVNVIVQAAQRRQIEHVPTPTLPLFLLDLACR